MEIPIRADVECADGPGGEVTHVIVHAATKKVTQIVVKEAKSPHAERVVPFRFVAEATAKEIRLRCSRQELTRMQPFIRIEVVETAWSQDGRMPTDVKKVKRLNIAEDELAMDTGTQVRATDGNVGRMDEVMVDPANGFITHLVMREGHVWAPKEATVPVSEVERLGDKAVYLRKDRAAVAALPAVPARRR